MRSYTGGELAMGRGSPILASRKPKLNTKSSNECDLVAVDESVLQGVPRDYGDALPSSKMRYTHLEACEEYGNTSKKDVANDSNGNTEVYPSDINKALPQTNKYKPLKLDAPVVAAQGTAFVTGGKGGTGKKVTKNYLSDDEWNH